MPILIPPPEIPPEPEPPAPPVLTDEVRRAVLVEARAHCAPSTWDAFWRSLNARGYPLDLPQGD